MRFVLLVHMADMDALCIIATCVGGAGFHSEALAMSKTCKATWTYEPLWGILKDVPGPCRLGGTRLMYCAKYGHIERLKWLLSRGADPNIQDILGDTALYLASLEGNLEIVVTLLAAGANTNLARMTDGYTPLMGAATWGHVEVVKELITHGAALEAQRNDIPEETIAEKLYDYTNPTWSSIDGATALLLACNMGHTAVVKELIAAGANVDAKTTADGMTCLMWAAAHGYTDIVIELLKKTTTVNAQKKNGRTALMLAAAARPERPVIIKALCEAGADVSITDGQSYTAAKYSIEYDNIETMEILYTYDARFRFQAWENLSFAVRVSATKIVKSLLVKYPEIQVMGATGNTLFEYAASLPGNMEILQILLNARVNKTYLPPILHIAARRGDTYMVQKLCEMGYPLNTIQHAFEEALERGHTGVALILQKFGAKIQKRSWF